MGEQNLVVVVVSIAGLFLAGLNGQDHQGRLLLVTDRVAVPGDRQDEDG